MRSRAMELEREMEKLRTGRPMQVHFLLRRPGSARSAGMRGGGVPGGARSGMRQGVPAGLPMPGPLLRCCPHLLPLFCLAGLSQKLSLLPPLFSALPVPQEAMKREEEAQRLRAEVGPSRGSAAGDKLLGSWHGPAAAAPATRLRCKLPFGQWP